MRSCCQVAARALTCRRRKRIRLGGLSTYSVLIGIAAYSAHLLEFFPHRAFDITIIADDQPRLGTDPDNVVRLWSKDQPDLDRVRDFILEKKFDAVLFQHNFGFYDFGEFADTLLALAEAGIEIFVALHRTRDLENQEGRVS